MRRKPVSILATIALLFAATPAAAEGILEQALARAAATPPAVAAAPIAAAGLQQGGCDSAVMMRGADNASTVGTGGYLAGGLLLPIIMPLIAGGGNPDPPISETMGMDPNEARCYSASYGQTLRDRRTASAWRGTWIGIGTYVGLSVLAAATGPGY